jgi:hypothetical protein
VEVLPFGLLVFVVGVLLIANAWGVIDAKMAAEIAAREASRAYAEATDDDPHAQARAAAASAIESYGRDKARMELTMRVADSAAGSVAGSSDSGLGAGAESGGDGQRPRRCQRVIFEVRYLVPAVVVPWVGGFGEGITAVGRHSEIVDPFRTGLSGEAICGPLAP